MVELTGDRESSTIRINGSPFIIYLFMEMIMPEGKRLVEQIHGGAGKFNPERAVKLIFAGVPKPFTDPTKYETPTPAPVLQKIKDFAQKNNIH